MIGRFSLETQRPPYFTDGYLTVLKEGISPFLVRFTRKVIALDVLKFFQGIAAGKVLPTRLILPNPVLSPMLSARCGIIRLISSG